MTVEIKLTRGYVAIVDDEDADLAEYKWIARVRKEKGGGITVYAMRTEWREGKGYSVLMHKVILERKLGHVIPTGFTVDHVDNLNSLNNRRENLRLATHQQNQMNRVGRSDRSAPYKGIRQYKKTGRWQARVCDRHLGYFDTPLEAHRAYCIAALTYHAPFHNFGANSPFAGYTLADFEAPAVQLALPIAA